MIKRIYKKFSSGHANIPISKGLNDAIMDFLDSKIAYESGFTSKAEVATEAVRNLLALNGYYANYFLGPNHSFNNCSSAKTPSIRRI